MEDYIIFNSVMLEKQREYLWLWYAGKIQNPADAKGFLNVRTGKCHGYFMEVVGSETVLHFPYNMWSA